MENEQNSNTNTTMSKGAILRAGGSAASAVAAELGRKGGRTPRKDKIETV